MPLSSSVTRRRRAAVSAAAATSLAVTTLALLSPPTQAAPTTSVVEAKQGYAGGPVNPTPYTLTQPDGTTLRVQGFGDALSNGVATVKGNYTIVKGKDGYWRYAAGLTASGQLRPSNVVAGDGPAPAAAQGLAPARPAESAPAQTPKAGLGDDKELVILVSFLDSAPNTTQADWAAKYFGAAASVDDFYDEASLGQFGVVPAAETSGTANNGVAGWYGLPYNHPNTGVVNAPETYIADAITAASADVNFASFDTDADGEIDTDELHVTVIGAGFETSYSGPSDTCGSSIWGHQWDLNSAGVTVPVVDGVEVGGLGYTTFGEMHCRASDSNSPGHSATIGIIAHEFGHDINWPDLYDVDGSSSGIGAYSLMSGGTWGGSVLPGDSPAHPDAWSLWYQGWVQPTAVTTTTNDIQVDTGESVLVSPNPGGVDWLFGGTSGTGEYFLIENRQLVGYDSTLPSCGLVVYRIDETVTSSNLANSDEDDPLVKVIEADGLDHLYLGSNRGDAGDPYPGSSNNHDLDNASDPDTKFHTGAPSNLDVHIDSNACAATMQLDVVQLAASTVVAAHVPEPSTYGSASSINVTVSSGSGTPTGQVTLQEGATTIGTGVLDGSGQASVTLPATTPAGSHNLTVSYAGDATHAAAIGNVTANVSKAASSTSATAPRKVRFRKNFNVKATVTAPAGSNTGSVQVMKGSRVLGTGTLSNGIATIRITKNLRRGRHTLTVAYLGSANASASQTTVTVRVRKRR